VTLADTYRLPVFRQELRYRHFWEWTTLAENQWTHDGRKLTAEDDHVPPDGALRFQMALQQAYQSHPTGCGSISIRV
jgi:hypothetical protein